MKFKSNTHVCLNVVLSNGSNKHISFTELTGKGSVFYTDSQEIANALRNHHGYNRLFREEQEVEKKPAEEKQEVKAEPNKKVFACNDDAKDYFADRYGVSRSKMRTRTSIDEVAKGLGFEIEWRE